MMETVAIFFVSGIFTSTLMGLCERDPIVWKAPKGENFDNVLKPFVHYFPVRVSSVLYDVCHYGNIRELNGTDVKKFVFRYFMVKMDHPVPVSGEGSECKMRFVVKNTFCFQGVNLPYAVCNHGFWKKFRIPERTKKFEQHEKTSQ